MIVSQYCRRNEEAAEELRARLSLPFGETMGRPHEGWGPVLVSSRPRRMILPENPPTLFIRGWQDENRPYLPQQALSLEGGSPLQRQFHPHQAGGLSGVTEQGMLWEVPDL